MVAGQPAETRKVGDSRKVEGGEIPTFHLPYAIYRSSLLRVDADGTAEGGQFHGGLAGIVRPQQAT